jgi:hypothetical protein
MGFYFFYRNDTFLFGFYFFYRNDTFLFGFYFFYRKDTFLFGFYFFFTEMTQNIIWEYRELYWGWFNNIKCI